MIQYNSIKRTTENFRKIKIGFSDFVEKLPQRNAFKQTEKVDKKKQTTHKPIQQMKSKYNIILPITIRVELNFQYNQRHWQTMIQSYQKQWSHTVSDQSWGK